MRDPVALAYSGRLDEARREAVAQAGADDTFLVLEGLEALAVLGQQHGVRSDPELDALLVIHARDEGRLGDRAFEAAAALESGALEIAAASRLESGRASWFVLRYLEERPSHRLASALAAGWKRLPAELHDEALLATCVLPAASREEAAEWGRRSAARLVDEREEVRLAALTALDTWRPAGAARLVSACLEDESPAVRERAVRVLARADPELLAARANELGAECPEALSHAPRRASTTR